MTEAVSKSFKVPKRKKEDSKDNLRKLELTNRDCKELMSTTERSYLDSTYSSAWDLKTAMLVENKDLEEKYRQKKNEMKEEGRRDLQDQYGFLLFKDPSAVTQTVKEGLKCQWLPFNGLGNSRLGVYVCRNADVQLKLAEGSGSQAVTLVIFKMTLGKCKPLTSNGADESTEPTPNFDCHVFQQPPRPSDSFSTQLARTQVYLYEYNDDCEPVSIPRQCLPYAVLSFRRSEKASTLSTFQGSVDSYSKRVVPALEKAKTDSDVPSKTEQKPLNASDSRRSIRDPRRASAETRTNPLDPRVAAITAAEGMETGLCVPHLSAVPLSVKPLGDPRLTTKQLVPGLPYPGYRPKFGPEVERQRQLDQVQEKLKFLKQNQILDESSDDVPDKPTDPRLARSKDPRSRDPRMKASRHKHQAENKPLGSVDDTNRKKISLSDYKKKMPLPLPETTESGEEDEDDDEEDNIESLVSDPAIQHLPPHFDIPTIKSSDDEEYDPAAYYPSSPTTSPPRADDEDIVERPEDMAKTLNALSDPDDASLSPNSEEDRPVILGLQEHIENAEDPALADAMRKLVEHSGNIELFTEALQSLQESAEEFGDALTNPEFLVKIIAEKIEELAKVRDNAEGKQEETEDAKEGNENVHEDMDSDIKSPDAIQSPDGLNHETGVNEVRHIPLENKEDPLAEAMRKTLQELEAAEKSVLDIPLPPNSPLEKLKSSSSTKDNFKVEEMELESDQDDHSLTKFRKHVNSSNLILTGSSQEDRDKRSLLEDLGFGSEDVDLRRIDNRPKAMATGNINAGPNNNSNQIAQPRVLTAGVQVSLNNDKKQIPVVQSHVQMDGLDVDLRKSVTNLNDDVDMRSNNLLTGEDVDLRVALPKPAYVNMESVPAVKPAQLTPSETSLIEKSVAGAAPRMSVSTPILPVSMNDPAFMDRDERTKAGSRSPPMISSVFMDIDERVPAVKADRVAIMAVKAETDSLGLKEIRNGDESDNVQTGIDPFSIGKSTEGDQSNKIKREVQPNVLKESTVEDKIEITKSKKDPFGLRDSTDGDKVKRETDSFELKESNNTDKIKIETDPYEIKESAKSNNIDKTKLQSDLPLESSEVPKSYEISKQSDDTDDKAKDNSITVENFKTDSLSSDGGLFDAYSLVKKDILEDKKEEITRQAKSTPELDNSFGDVDWRQVTTTEMGDVDWRSSQSSSQRSESVDSQILPSSHPNSSYSSSQYNSEPGQGIDIYSTMNQSGSIYPTNTNFEQYHTTTHQVSSYSSSSSYNYYSTSKSSVESYSTSAKLAGEYKTSRYPRSSDQYGYSGSHDYSNEYEQPPVQKPERNQPSTQLNFPGSIQNVMHNVDFSSLKNILASVGQVPSQGQGQSRPATEQQKPWHVETSHSDSDDDSQNKPAFCTGLSFLKSKQPKDDFTRAKYTGKAKIQPDVGPPPVNPEPLAPWAKRTFDKHRVLEVEGPAPKHSRFGGFDNKPFGGGGGLHGPSQWDEDIKPMSTIGIERKDPVGASSSVFSVGFNLDRSSAVPGLDKLSNRTIPGFDPVSEESDDKPREGEEGQPFRFSEDIPDRDIKSMWYVEPFIHENKRDRKSKHKDSDSEDSDFKPQTKRSKHRDKDKNRYSDDNEVSPAKKRDKKKNTPTKEETGNWQDLILESMEESELTVRHDDALEDVTETKKGVESNVVKNLFEDKVETVNVEKALPHEREPGEILDADSDDEEVNLVIDLDSDHKKECKSDKTSTTESYNDDKSDVKSKGKMAEEEHVEEGEVDSVLVIDTQPEKQASEELEVTTLENTDKEDDDLKIDEGKTVLHKQDDIKDFIEDKRKKIVIRFKNETKIVNPKTGKAYTENAVGSAIQVVGQPSKPPMKPINKEMKQTQQVQGIQTIGSGQNLRHVSTVNTSQYSSPSPIMQQSNISSIATRVSSGPGFRSTSPVNIPQPLVEVQPGLDKPLPLHYIHPVTGQTVRYGSQPVMPPSIQPLPMPMVAGMRPIQPVPVSNIDMVVVQPVRMIVPMRNQRSTGMPIHIVGQSGPSSHNVNAATSFINAAASEVRPSPNYTMSKNSAIKVIQTQNISDASAHYKNIPSQPISSLMERKRVVIDKRRNSAETKRPRIEEQNIEDSGDISNKMAQVLEQHDIETLSKVKDVIKSTLENLDEEEVSPKRKVEETGTSSELEDGEISDDDDDIVGGSPVKLFTDSHRVVMNRDPSYGPCQRIQSLGAGQLQEPPTRIVPNVGLQSFQSYEQGRGLYRTASEWSDMIKHEDRTPIERVRGSNNSSLKSRFGQVAEVDVDLLSKSAASITKTKQKIVARSQVKTLGDWLKIELETDNIQPLQNIIPYALNTDLSIIPKQRRRKIRLNVKNAIEKEGYRKTKVDVVVEINCAPMATSSPSSLLASSSLSSTKPVIQPNYSPEVGHDEIKKELEIITRITTEMKQQKKAAGVLPVSIKKNELLSAFDTVEFEMRGLLQRTSFYGYPNRRVPNDILLEEELHSFKSEEEDVFLILMTPFSMKPYHRLLNLKKELDTLIKEKNKCTGDPSKIKVMEEDIKRLHGQRQSVIRSFTGYLNKKRINRLQELEEKYTTVHNYFKQQRPPVPDNMIRFVRTTQMDLRQHLILAKQYLAMEEKKNSR